MALSKKEWDQRVLCSDGNCIGTVGADRRCKVCGRRYDGELPSIVNDDEIAGEPTDDVQGEPLISEGETVVEEKTVFEEDTVDDNWDNRVLCADESCIGVIGSDGKCKECGKPYPG